MKKEYISPEVKIMEFGLDDGIFLCASTSLGGPEEDGYAREYNEYDSGNKKSPGSNLWDQSW